MAKTTAITNLKQTLDRAFGDTANVKAVGSSTVDKLIGIFQSNPPARGISPRTSRTSPRRDWTR